MEKQPRIQNSGGWFAFSTKIEIKKVWSVGGHRLHEAYYVFPDGGTTDGMLEYGRGDIL